MQVARGRGTVLLVGTAHAPLTFTGPQFEAISRKELNVVGSWMNYSAPFPGAEWKTAAWMMEAGLIKVDALQTHTFPIEQIQRGSMLAFFKNAGMPGIFRIGRCVTLGDSFFLPPEFKGIPQERHTQDPSRRGYELIFSEQ